MQYLCHLRLQLQYDIKTEHLLRDYDITTEEFGIYRFQQYQKHKQKYNLIIKNDTKHEHRQIFFSIFLVMSEVVLSLIVKMNNEKQQIL